MKCWSRSTLGVIIGIVNIVCFIGLIIVSIVFINKMASVQAETVKQKTTLETSTITLIWVIVYCLVMIIISGLLIMGIVKKYHKLMLPWLVLSGMTYIYNCVQFFWGLFVFASSNASIILIFGNIFGGLIAFTIGGLIFWTIYSLYTDIRRDNMEKPDRAIMTAEIGYVNHHT